jgi:uncharacterized protein with FMN-binding domain
MRKAVVVIIAVAIIGALGAYGTSHAHSNNQPSQVQSSNTSSPNPVDQTSSNTATNYKDGTYTGDSEDTPYGTVQIAVVVSGGKVSDINFLQMPNDQEHSQEITNYSEPLLKQQAIQKQSANIDFVSGATVTSDGYQRSLQSALDQAA